MTTDTATNCAETFSLTRERAWRPHRPGRRGCIDSLTMRGSAGALRRQAMSLYNHVGQQGRPPRRHVDVIVGDIVVPASGTDWRSAARAILLGHEMLLAHPCRRMQITSRYSIAGIRATSTPRSSPSRGRLLDRGRT